MGRRLSACQAAQKALSIGRETLAGHGASLRPRNRAACGKGRRMERGWYICPAGLTHTERHPQLAQVQMQPGAWEDQESSVPALAPCDLGLAFCIYKTGAEPPSFLPSCPPCVHLHGAQLLWPWAPRLISPWALLECDRLSTSSVEPRGFCPWIATMITSTQSHRKGQSPELLSFALFKALRVTSVYFPNGLLPSEEMKSGR